MIPHPPSPTRTSPLFPYTTPFRSRGRRVVLRIHPPERWSGEDRGAERVLGIAIGTPHALVDHRLEAPVRLQPAILPPFHEDGDDARVLADRPVPLGAHADRKSTRLNSSH